MAMPVYVPEPYGSSGNFMYHFRLSAQGGHAHRIVRHIPGVRLRLKEIPDQLSRIAENAPVFYSNPKKRRRLSKFGYIYSSS